MKLKVILLQLVLCSTFMAFGQKKGNVTIIPKSITDSLTTFSPSSVKVEGYLGEKINLVIDKRIKGQDADYLVEPFRHRNENHLWQSEFWGKWIQSAIAAYEYNHDPELLSLIERGINGILSTQSPNGYFGNYSDSAQLKEWDIWGRKYTLLGLLAYHKLTGDKRTLVAAMKLADHLLTQVGTGKKDIVETGNYRGMPSSSILEPMVYLYLATGEKKYLEFSKYIAAQWELPDGPKLISKALAGIPVAERFPHPDVWWSYENGSKAYEMMSCYDGLLELYRITGDPDYLKAVRLAVRDIIDKEINMAGSGSSFECFYGGAKKQTQPSYHTMETCVTMTWMKLCFNLLRLTGDPLYADQIEKSVYNALLASVKDDGSQIEKYSPLEGVRHAGEEQCGMNINCCNANGPRAFMMIPRYAIMKSGKGITVNLYGQVKSEIPLNDRNRVGINIVSDYPLSGKIEFEINPALSESFTVALRIPEWSKANTLIVNGIEEKGVVTGLYKKVTRVWKKGDKVVLNLDMSGRLTRLNGQQAIERGPVVLARDTRFGDGNVYETSVIQEKNGHVELQQSPSKPVGIWMAFTAPLVLGTDLEGEFRNPRQIHVCDFASAGNTWDEKSRYKVWLTQTLNVMNKEYKPY